MEIVFSLLAGVLMSASVWLMLSRNLVKFLFGLVLISNVANLVIFTTGGLTYGVPPFIGDHAAAEGYANPLPQALILTAIVIGFGLTSFTLVLAMRAYREIGTVHVDDMCLAEQRQTVERGPADEHPPLSNIDPDVETRVDRSDEEAAGKVADRSNKKGVDRDTPGDEGMDVGGDDRIDDDGSAEPNR